jgi:hypothetical protein
MKVQAEITYTVDEEPESFLTVSEIASREVYLWLDQRGILETDSPWTTQQRLSTVLQSNGDGFMEVWTSNKDDSVSPSPPLSPDDHWLESYKILRHKNYNVQYHPETKLLRFVWLQSMDTLIQNKILASVSSAVEEYGRSFPNLPVLSAAVSSSQ